MRKKKAAGIDKSKQCYAVLFDLCLAKCILVVRNRVIQNH